MVGAGALRGFLRLPLLLAASVVATACAAAGDFPDPSNPVTSISWPDYELLRYLITDQTNATLGTAEFEIERDGDEFQMRILFLLPDSGVSDEVFLRTRADTLKPVRYSRLATSPDERVEAGGVYGRDAEGQSIVDTTLAENGEQKLKRVTIGEFAFDNDSAAWLWRSIAFAQDFGVTYRSVNVRQQRSQLVRLRVVGQDLVRTPAGEFLAWQLEVLGGAEVQHVWFQVEPPHRLVRWDLQPRQYHLMEIVTQRPAGD